MADIKNYGLKGIGDDVQLGKSGGRFVFNTGASDFRVTTDGTTLAHIQVLTPVADTDAATKLYVDNTAAGLDPKQSCQASTTAALSGAVYATSPSNGQFTSVAVAIDGVTLAEGDRVLVKDQADAKQNGIYEVQATTTTLTRAGDQDGSPASEVSAGNFTFIEAGTVNADTGWVLQGDGNLLLNTNSLNWVLFSTSGDVVAGNGLVKNGNALDLDFSELASAAVIATADELIFQDGTVESRITVANFISDRSIAVTVGTPANNQIGVWTGDGTIEGDAGLTFDGTNLDLSTAGRVRTGNSTQALPAFSFSSETNTGIFRQGAGSLGISLLGTGHWLFEATSFFGNLSGGPQLMFEAATATNPTLVARLSDTDSGIGSAAADAISIIAGGVEAIRFTEVSSSILQASEANVGLTADVGSAQGNGVITSSYNVYSTVANAGDAATLPGTFIVGTTVYVKNDGANSMDVFPTLGDDAGAGLNTAVAIAAGESATFIGTSASATWSKLIVAPADATPTAITVADSTDTTSFPAFFESATGDLGPKTDASNYTYNATTGALTAGSYIGSNLTDNRVLIAGTSGLIEDDANFTFNGTTLALTAAMDITGDLDVDNINLNGNTISITDVNGNVTIQPNGTGQITLANGSGEEILELQDTVGALNGLLITAGATGVAPDISSAATGSEANVDIGFSTKGTGVLSVTAGAGAYEDNVTADDDIPNKKYVDDQIQLTGGSGTLDSVEGSVNLAVASVQNIGAATGIPANATILSVTLDITTLSDALTTVTVGDVTNGAASYMTASENDPTVAETFISDGRLLNGAGARQATATVAVQGTVGAAICIITFRHA